MVDPLQGRMNEKKIYEEIVNIIVDYIYNEFRDDESARLRIYSLIADNFDGMVRALTAPSLKESSIINIEDGDLQSE